MGFRSTFTSDDCGCKWPAWFREKYSATVHFPPMDGPIASVCEGKTYGLFADLPTDIQRVVQETQTGRVVLVFLHECGGITRCEITAASIRWNEPVRWEEVYEVTHNYCYGCSDVPSLTSRADS